MTRQTQTGRNAGKSSIIDYPFSRYLLSAREPGHLFPAAPQEAYHTYILSYILSSAQAHG